MDSHLILPKKSRHVQHVKRDTDCGPISEAILALGLVFSCRGWLPTNEISMLRYVRLEKLGRLEERKSRRAVEFLP